jgi:radical SAM superfamily enzyme YgiQ (UPF0313 family)
MRIAFVYAGIATIGWNSYNKFGRGLDDYYAIPQGIAYLRALLLQDGRHEADIIDFRMLSGPEEYRQKLIDGKYDVVGISCLTPSRDYAVLAAEIAKELGMTTLAGGVHASALPDDFAGTGFFDCVVVGEGEITLFEILEMIEQGKELPRVYRTVNYVKDLDELPFPATAYLPTYEHAFEANDGLAGVTASRGCPGRCKYCWPNQFVMYGTKSIRWRTPQNIVEEMLYLKNHFPIKLITFYDDTFSWNKKWLREFRDHVRERREHGVDIPPIAVNARANTFDNEVAEILKELGCVGVWFGFESGSPRILKILNKGCTLEQNIRAAKICREAGFDVNANILVGIPGETKEDYLLTYKFLKTIQPNNVRYNVLSPYPGSQFYEELAPQGLIDVQKYQDYDVATPHITGKGVIRSVDYNLVMKWANPFRSLAEATRLRRENKPLLARAFVLAWRLRALPLPDKILLPVVDFLGKMYPYLKRA